MPEEISETPQIEIEPSVEEPRLTRYSVSRKGVQMLSCIAIEDALYVLRSYKMDSVSRLSDGKLMAIQCKSGLDFKKLLKLGDSS